MIPYFVLFGIFFLVSALEQVLDKKYIGLLKPFAFSLLVIFATFRPAGGDRDYDSYVFGFEMFEAPADFFNNFSDWAFFEPFYYLIPSFLKTYVSINYYVILTFLTYAFIAVSLKLIGISKLSNYFFLSLLIYFSNFFLLHEMTQIRAGVAAGFLLIGIWLIERKSYFLLVLALLLSMLFHYSSFIILSLLFFRPGNINKPLYLGLLGLTAILSLVDTSFVYSFLNFDLGPLTFRSANYIAVSEYEGVDKINKLNTIFLLSFFTTATFVYFSDLLNEKSKYVNIMLKMQVFGLFFFQLFSAVPIFSFRISELLILTQRITLPMFVHLFKNKWVGFACVVLIASYFLLINLLHLKLMKSYII